VSPQIAVRLSDDELTALDKAVERGEFPSRAAAVRAGLDGILTAARERTIAEEYRRAYADQPPDDELHEAGAMLAGEVINAEEARRTQ